MKNLAATKDGVFPMNDFNNALERFEKHLSDKFEDMEKLFELKMTGLEKRLGDRLDGLREEIGVANDTETGGTGLAGRVARTNVKVEEIFRWKFLGAGFVLALSITGAFLLIGIKAWIVDLLKG